MDKRDEPWTHNQMVQGPKGPRTAAYTYTIAASGDSKSRTAQQSHNRNRLIRTDEATRSRMFDRRSTMAACCVLLALAFHERQSSTLYLCSSFELLAGSISSVTTYLTHEPHIRRIDDLPTNNTPDDIVLVRDACSYSF